MKNESYQLKKSVEISYDLQELHNLKYVKLIFKRIDGKYHEIATKIKFVGEHLVSLYCKYDKNINMKCPQEVIVKFITDDYMYLSKATMKDAKILDDLLFFTILPPQNMIKQQKRKYYRADLDCLCMLEIIDKNNKSTAYIAKSVNISANGILIHKLETLHSDGFVELEMSAEDYYNIVIFLEPDLVFKQQAKFIRQERKNNICRYAFHLISTNGQYVDAICKYVTNEQLKQLQKQKEKDVNK